uniref:Reverse transcriptase domain-containing protein n=1 Tax=Ananas comosus var. bracteatus TaxID=296719 RepID=A0A6V7P2B1_ANACO|nr:unnamed protein product [Ananas comosus var. bracteatus]
MEQGPSSGRPCSSPVFLPSRPSPSGLPSFSGCVALAEVLGPIGGIVQDVKVVLSNGLAARFGGSSREFLVADFDAPLLAVFFPNWVTREGVISRSPFRFEGVDFKLSNWSEVAELDRGHLRHMAWVRLHHWPILCWNEEDVKAAVSGFGELWEIDPLSERRLDVSFFRAKIRCQDIHSIPETLRLMVDDRRFQISVEIESWEDANPILLGDDLDDRLGLETSDAQDRFIRHTHFSSAPAQGSQVWPRNSRGGAHLVQHRSSSEFPSSGGVVRQTVPVSGGLSDRLCRSLGVLSRLWRSPEHFKFKFGFGGVVTQASALYAVHPCVVDVSTDAIALNPTLLPPPSSRHFSTAEQSPSLSLVGPASSVKPLLVEPAVLTEPWPSHPGEQPAPPGVPSPSEIRPPLPGGPSNPACWSPSSGGLSISVSRPPYLGPYSSASRPASPGAHSISASRTPPSGGPSFSGSRQPAPVGPTLAEASLIGHALGDEALSESVGTRFNHHTLHSGASFLVSNKLGSFRRSLRLASKNMGINRSSLQRAQDLMCSKLQSLKASHCTPSSPTTMPVDSIDPSSEAPPVHLVVSPLAARNGWSLLSLGLMARGVLHRPRKGLKPSLLPRVVSLFPFMARNRVFRFLSWNVRGLNDQSKCTVVRSFIRFSKVSVVCLQETKLPSISAGKFRSFCGFHLQEFRTLDAVGTRGGLLTAWNIYLFDCVQHWNGSHTLNVLLQRKSDRNLFLITNVYGPSGSSNKASFFLELRHIANLSRSLWAALGDFNVLLSLNDKNGLPSNTADILAFREAVSDAGLIDLPIMNKSFTWSNGRRNPTLERLDRVLISQDWLLCFPRSTLKALPRPRSDHTPLVLSAWTFVPTPRIFRFESSWLHFPTLPGVVANAWNSAPTGVDPASSFSSKLDKVRKDLQLWSRDLSSSLKRQSTSCLQWLLWLDSAEERRVLSASECCLRPKLKIRYEELCLIEESKWKQRSRIQWLREGDANTKFFHLRASCRRSANSISHLSDGTNALSSHDAIANHLFSYYLNLIGSAHQSSSTINFFLIYDDATVDLSSLHSPFSEDEVRSAIFACAPDKARDRTASHCSSTTTAFIKGRHILDNFYCAHILIHHLHASKRPAALFKIDFDRAFDHINWIFLNELLTARGFSNKWIGWISALLNSTTSAVLLNGVPGTSFQCRRGLRQGDPLSPLLFNICIDVLFRLLDRAVLSDNLPAVGIGDVKIHSLHFADDVLLFFDGSVRSAIIIRCILDAFSANSGLTINYGKSSLSPINIPADQAAALATCFNCPLQSFPLLYLGLPLTPKPLRRADYLPSSRRSTIDWLVGSAPLSLEEAALSFLTRSYPLCPLISALRLPFLFG